MNCSECVKMNIKCFSRNKFNIKNVRFQEILLCTCSFGQKYDTILLQNTITQIAA